MTYNFIMLQCIWLGWLFKIRLKNLILDKWLQIPDVRFDPKVNFKLEKIRKAKKTNYTKTPEGWGFFKIIFFHNIQSPIWQFREQKKIWPLSKQQMTWPFARTTNNHLPELPVLDKSIFFRLGRGGNWYSWT